MAEFIVTTTEDQNDGSGDNGLSLREAVALANANPGADKIRFAVGLGKAFEAGGVIRLQHGQIEITDAVTIDGSDVGAALTITGDALGNDTLVDGTNATWLEFVDKAVYLQIQQDSNGLESEYPTAMLHHDWLADNAGRIFDITAPAASTTLRGLVITGGRVSDEDGGGVRSAAPLEVVNSAVVGNRVEGAGGGGGVAGAMVGLTNTTVAGNETDEGDGGGVLADAVELLCATVAGNAAHNLLGAGGISAVDITGYSSLISSNYAVEAIYVSFTYAPHNGIGSWYPVSFYNDVYYQSNYLYQYIDGMFNVNAEYENVFELHKEISSSEDWDTETWGYVTLISPIDGGNGIPVVALKASAGNLTLDAADAALAAGIATDGRGKGFARVVDQPGVGGGGTTALDLGAYELQAGPFGPVETSPVIISAAGSGAAGASPHFTVYADGVAIGSGKIANPDATLGAAAYETFCFQAAAEPSKVEIVFDNDGRAPDGSDINLRIGEVGFGGEYYLPLVDGDYVRANGEDLGPQRSMWWNGTLGFGTRTEQVVTIYAAGTGDADAAPAFRVLADGVEIGRGAIADPAASCAGLNWESFEFRYPGHGPAEQVVVEFLNDQRTPAGVDVNLIVDQVAFGGETYDPRADATYVRYHDGADLGATPAMWWNGDLVFEARDEIGLVGWVESLGGQAQALAVEGSYAYVGDSGIYGAPARFQVIDVSDPTDPVIFGSLASAGNQEITEIDLAAGYVFMSNDANGVVKIDVSDPDTPFRVSSRSDGSFASDFDSDDGRYGFETWEYSQGHEMSVYDLSTFPAAPVAQHDAFLPDTSGGQHAARVDVAGDRAYVAGHTYDGSLDRPYLEIIDVSDPDHPAQISRLSLPWATYGNYSGEVEYADGFVFVARSLAPGSGLTVPGGLVIVDARDETAPVVAAHVTIPDATGTALPGGALGPGLDIVGDVAYLAARSGVYVFDVSDPYDPEILVDPNVDTAFALPAAFAGSLGGEVEVEGRYAYMTAHEGAASGGLAVFRLPDDPGDPASFDGFADALV
jgi:CSLREA domain-containing protein